MNHEDFAKIVDHQLDQCRDLLVTKAKEYAPGDDRFVNFKASAALQGVSNVEALAGYMSKHTVSLYEMIRADETYSLAKWDEKISDHINYLLLLKGLLVEEQGPDLTEDPSAAPDPNPFSVSPNVGVIVNNQLPGTYPDANSTDSIPVVLNDPH